MLTSAALLPLLLAAALNEPLTGAFGFEFGKPVRPSAVAAAIAKNDLIALPDNISLAEPSELPPEHSRWRYLIADQLPDNIARSDPKLLALLTENGHPARLIVTVAESGCDGVYDWLTASLARKYRVEDDAAVPARAPHLRASRYQQGQRQIDVACGPDVLLQYTDQQALLRWHEEQTAAFAAIEARAQRETQALEQVAEFRSRQLADQFTLGDSARLQGGLGIVFKQPWTGLDEFTADQPTAVVLNDLPAPFDSGRYEIELAPDRVPIELTGSFPDAQGEHFDALTRALRAKYGEPIKNSARHRIFQVNGNFFTLRLLPQSARTQITLLDGSARRAQRQRAKAAAEAEVAAVEEAFRRETDGL